MSRRRKIVIPEIATIANNLRVRGQTRLAATLDDYAFTRNHGSDVKTRKTLPITTPKKIMTKAKNLDDKIAKFNFICGGNDAS